MIYPPQEFWEVFRNTDGAISCAEAIAIINFANIAPSNGIFAEFGVYRGKSAMSAAYGGNPAQFHLVEPEFEKGISTSEISSRIGSVVKNKMELVFVVGNSVDYISNTNGNFSYVFIDSGDHQSLPMIEVKLLEDRIEKGGIISFHDLFSQFIQVEDAYNYLLSTGKYEELILSKDSIIEYCKEKDLESLNQSWHHKEVENPFFIGALMRK